MKRFTPLFLFTLFTTVLMAVDVTDFPSYCYAPDGKTVISGPRLLPTQGRKASDGSVVVGLDHADAATLADCGWYLYVADTNTCPTGQTLVSNVYAVVGTTAVQHKFFALPPFKSWEISKYKLSALLAGAGKLDAFRTLIAADASRQFLWDACQTLDRTNTLVLAIEQAAPSTFGVDATTVSNLLWEARVNVR